MPTGAAATALLGGGLAVRRQSRRPWVYPTNCEWTAFMTTMATGLLGWLLTVSLVGWSDGIF